MKDKVRLIRAWVGTLDEREKAILITTLILTTAEADKIPFEEVIGELTKSLLKGDE